MAYFQVSGKLRGIWLYDCTEASDSEEARGYFVSKHPGLVQVSLSGITLSFYQDFVLAQIKKIHES